MNVKRLLVLTIVLLGIFSVPAIAQNRTVTGKVTDSKDGSPLPNITVAVKGTHLATSTATDGSFRINQVPPTATTLEISSVGYASHSVPIGSGNVNASLTQINSTLNDVVVVGYGVQRRRDVTGAISKVTSEQLTAAPVQSFEAALEGKAPGVQVITGNGLAGSGSVVRIRGAGTLAASGDPLYVLDGIPIINDPFITGDNHGFNENPLASINPNDIESVEILKDAGATGIYGSRGANGVILITTKRGKNRKPTFTYSDKLGVATYTVKPDFVNGPEWLQLRQEAWLNSGNVGLATLPSGVTWAQAQNNNTDWWKLITRDGIIDEHSLSFTTGGNKLKTFANFTYGDDEGYIVNNSLTRISGRLNMDYTVSKKLKLALTAGYNRSINEQQLSTPTTAMQSALPIYSVYTDATHQYFSSNTANPVRDQTEQQQREYTNRLIGGLTADWQPVKNLFLKGVGSIENVNNISSYFQTSRYRYGEMVDSASNLGLASASPYFGYNWTATFTANYLVNIKDKHKFNFMVGNEEQQTKMYNYSAAIQQTTGSPFWDHLSDYTNIKNALLAMPTGGITKEGISGDSWTFNSFFARVNYSYLDRYSVQLVAREDGSSKFGPNNKHGFFPSASAAWTISEEPWLKGNRDINFLKLRTSYGIVGNAAIGGGLYYDNYRQGSVPYIGANTLYLNQPGNPDLQWETLKNFDAAIEYGLFNNRLSGEIAYYHKLSSNILFYVGNQPSTGFGGYWRNLPNTEILNQGIEISADYKVINTKNVKWSVGGNISKNQNKVVSFDAGADASESASYNDTRIIVGYPIGTNYLVRYHGVDPVNGLPIWLDQNGKQTENFSLNYRVPVGSVQPDWTGGFNTSVSYKSFDFSTLFNFVIGGNIYDGSGKYIYGGVEGGGANFRTDFLDRWQKPGDIAKYPKLVSNIAQYPGVPNNDQFNSTMFLYSGSYLRMREIALGYRVPRNVFKNSFIKDLKITISGNNLLTFTKYPEDPEVIRDFSGQGTNSSNNNSLDKNLSPNVAYYTTPAQKTFILALNITF